MAAPVTTSTATAATVPIPKRRAAARSETRSSQNATPPDAVRLLDRCELRP